VCLLWQPNSSKASRKRSRAKSRTVEPQRQPLAAIAHLPTAVWEDHLLPLVVCKEAARLGSTCKALKVVMRDHYRGDLGMVAIDKLKAALMTFPRARSGELTGDYGQISKSWGLLEWLCVGGHGRDITTLTTTQPKYVNDISTTVLKALRQGALPSLRSVDVDLMSDTQREVLMEGLLGAMHELRLRLSDDDPSGPQLAALSMVRQCPPWPSSTSTCARWMMTPCSGRPSFHPPSRFFASLLTKITESRCSSCCCAHSQPCSRPAGPRSTAFGSTSRPT
jgi:hypothetical protein